jgi:hypothetical protein
MQEQSTECTDSTREATVQEGRRGQSSFEGLQYVLKKQKKWYYDQALVVVEAFSNKYRKSIANKSKPDLLHVRTNKQADIFNNETLLFHFKKLLNSTLNLMQCNCGQ